MQFCTSDPIYHRLGLGAVALRYAQMGYPVLPLARGGKVPHRMLPPAPRGRGGVYLASRDPASIEWAWQKDRAAGIGVACGQVSGLMLIDLDIKHGKDGPGVLSRFLAERQFTLPDGPCVSTPSDGRHLWLRIPAGVAVPCWNEILPGIDIKGDGGYAVAPPSRARAEMTNDRGQAGIVLRPYEWISGCPCSLPEAPGWVLDWVKRTPSPRRAARAHGRCRPARTDGAGGHASASDLGELARTGVPPGQRNETLYRLACSRYRKNGSGSPLVLEELRRVWMASDRTSMPWHEVEALAASAEQFIASQEQQDRLLMTQWLGRTGTAPAGAQ
jgi:hypothetical protein